MTDRQTDFKCTLTVLGENKRGFLQSQIFALDVKFIYSFYIELHLSLQLRIPSTS